MAVRTRCACSVDWICEYCARCALHCRCTHAISEREMVHVQSQRGATALRRVIQDETAKVRQLDITDRPLGPDERDGQTDPR